MPEAAPSIRVGTCGWSYKDWVGPFYPKGLAPADYLPYYAEHFSIVEVDSSFYRSPSKSMVQGWRDKTPEGFSFSLKVPQTITHEKVLVDCSGEAEEFVSAARLLGRPRLMRGTVGAASHGHAVEFFFQIFLADWSAPVENTRKH